MENKSIDSMLQSFSKNEDDTWLMNVMQLNMDCIIALQKQKTKSILSSLVNIKAIVAFLGILWIWFLVFLLVHSLTIEKIFFVVSVAAIVIFNVYAVVIYIMHIVLIKQINKSNSITETQHKLARLQTSTMQITRVLFLQSPFYTTWFLSVDMLAGASTIMLIFQFFITAFFTFLSVWLYRNINFENAGRKWFKILFSGKEWTSVTKAIAFMQEIEDFKNDK